MSDKRKEKRPAYHLSFRRDDPYEARIHEAMEDLPRGYAKDAILNMIREFIPRNMRRNQIHQLLMDFAKDVRAQRVVKSPHVAPSAEEVEPQPRPRVTPGPTIAATPPPPRRSGAQLMFEARPG